MTAFPARWRSADDRCHAGIEIACDLLGTVIIFHQKCEDERFKSAEVVMVAHRPHLRRSVAVDKGLQHALTRRNTARCEVESHQQRERRFPPRARAVPAA